MKVPTRIATIMLALGFLANVVAAFLLADVSAITPTDEDPLTTEAVKQTGAQIGTITPRSSTP